MKVLLTGHDGYLGSVMRSMLAEAGHSVLGTDACYFSEHGPQQDLRDVGEISNFDAVIHLSGLSNDPLGELNPRLTQEINFNSTVSLASKAKMGGVKRFIFSSSCSVYGCSDGIADEYSEIHPLTEYAKSKAAAENTLLDLDDDDFAPVILRNATAFGWSPNFRSDLVLNTMTCAAYTQNHINIVGDGTQWRPLCHVQDICHAFILALEAPREKVHNQIFNIGTRNYQVRAIASAVAELFPSCIVTNSENKDIDPRSYQVDFTKAKRELGFSPSWSLRDGIEELKDMFDTLDLSDFSGCVRLAKLKSLIEDGKIDKDLRWINKG